MAEATAAVAPAETTAAVAEAAAQVVAAAPDAEVVVAAAAAVGSLHVGECDHKKRSLKLRLVPVVTHIATGTLQFIG